MKQKRFLLLENLLFPAGLAPGSSDTVRFVDGGKMAVVDNATTGKLTLSVPCAAEMICSKAGMYILCFFFFSLFFSGSLSAQKYGEFAVTSDEPVQTTYNVSQFPNHTQIIGTDESAFGTDVTRIPALIDILSAENRSALRAVGGSGGAFESGAGKENEFAYNDVTVKNGLYPLIAFALYYGIRRRNCFRC